MSSSGNEYENRWPEDRKTWPQIIADITERFLDLKRWGFQESARLQTRHTRVIYNSEWCRIQLLLTDRRRFGGFETIGIYYGRLHAPNEGMLMIWNGQQCHCWHRIDNTALHFLDGLSPEEAAERQGLPPIMDEFLQSDLAKSITYYPEQTARMHAVVWEHYGQRLFDLFDLRQSDLWEEYSQFVREFYEINGQGSNPIFNPPLYRIC